MNGHANEFCPSLAEQLGHSLRSVLRNLARSFAGFAIQACEESGKWAYAVVSHLRFDDSYCRLLRMPSIRTNEQGSPMLHIRSLFPSIPANRRRSRAAFRNGHCRIADISAAKAEILEQRALLTLTIHFDFNVIASDLSSDLRVFGSTDPADAPYEVIRYGQGTLTDLDGFVGGDILANPGDLTFSAGSMDVNAPVEVLRLDRDSFDDGTSDGVVNQNYIPGDDNVVRFYLRGEFFAHANFNELNLEVTSDGSTTGVGQLGPLSQPPGVHSTREHSDLRELMNRTFSENSDGNDSRGREFSLTPFQYDGTWAGVGDAAVYSSTGEMTSNDDFPDARPFAPVWNPAASIDGVASRTSDADIVQANLDPTQTHVLRLTSSADVNSLHVYSQHVPPMPDVQLAPILTQANGSTRTITFNPRTANTVVSIGHHDGTWNLEHVSSSPASLNVFFPEELTVGWTPELDENDDPLPADGYRITLNFAGQNPFYSVDVGPNVREVDLANELAIQTQYLRVGRIVGNEVQGWSDVLPLHGVIRRVDQLLFDGTTISWQGIPGIDRYDVYLGPTDERFVVTGTEFTLPDDYPLGFGQAWVRPRLSHTSIPWSLPLNFVSRSRVQQPSVDLSTPERPVISWPELGGAADYDIYLQQLGSGAGAPIEVIGHSGTSWTPGNDLQVGRYRVWVRGSSSTVLKGRWSPVTEFNVSAVPISATGTSEAVTFEWAAPAGSQSVELYILHRGTVTVRSGLQGTTWTENQSFGTGYLSWWVRATDGTGLPGPWSDGSTIRINATRITSYPTETLKDFDTFGLAWDPVLNAASYEVLINSTVQAGVIEQTGLTTTSVDGLNLPGGRYKVWVNTVFGDGSNRYSRPVTFDVMTDGERVIVTPWGASANPPTISWVQNEFPRATKIFYRRLEDNQNAQVVSAVGATSYEFTEALPAGTYRVWAAQSGTNNWSVPIVIAIASLDDADGEGEDTMLAGINVLQNNAAAEADRESSDVVVPPPAAEATASEQTAGSAMMPASTARSQKTVALPTETDDLAKVFADLSDPSVATSEGDSMPAAI